MVSLGHQPTSFGGDPMRAHTKILSRQQVKSLLGISDATLWRMRNTGRFPRAISVSPGRIGWFECDVVTYLENHRHKLERG